MIDIFDILGNGFFDGLAEDDKRILSIPAFGHHESGVLGIKIPV